MQQCVSLKQKEMRDEIRKIILLVNMEGEKRNLRKDQLIIGLKRNCRKEVIGNVFPVLINYSANQL